MDLRIIMKIGRFDCLELIVIYEFIAFIVRFSKTLICYVMFRSVLYLYDQVFSRIMVFV